MKKIIGVCLTQANSEICREFVRYLHASAKKNNSKIIIYNSVVDFTDNAYLGAKYVYYSIPYEKLSALVILHETIFDSSLLDKIIRDAKEHNVPVIMARKYDPRCYSIIGEYEDAYTNLLKTVIKERNIKKTCYIAGRNTPEIDYDSKLRIQCYKNALEDSGLEFSLDNVEFGSYWEFPTRKVFERLMKKSSEMPDAIFCANDIMAETIINLLNSKGIKVPDDIYVAGFDGLECYRCSSPNITTCREEMDVLCDTIFEIIKKHEDKTIESNAFYYGYKPIFSETCGYENEQVKESLQSGNDAFKTLRYNHAGEEIAQKWFGKVLNNPTIDEFYKVIPEYVMQGFSVAMAPCEVARIINKRYHTLDEKLIVYSTDGTTLQPRADKFLAKDLVPNFDEWMKDDTVCYVTGVYVEDLCYGQIYEKGDIIDRLGYSTQRHAYTIINALKICVNQDL